MGKLRFKDAQTRAWARLLRAQRRVTDAVQAALTNAGLPPLEWYDVLFELKMAPEHRLRQVDLGKRVVLAKSNLTRLLNRMGEAGLIERIDCTVDKRVKYASITAKGEWMLREMWPVYREALQRRFNRHYNAKESRTIATLLERID